MKRLTVVLTVALVMSFSTSALASVASGGSEGDGAAAAVAPPAQDLRSADARVPSERVAGPDVVFETVTVPDGGGLSPLVIVLITLGASVALGATVLTALRVVHARQPVA